MSIDNIVEARGLSKPFCGFHAVQDVDLSIQRHSIRALSKFLTQRSGNR